MTRTRVRTSALLMCSTAFTVVMLLLASAQPVSATNCCQTCESLDATCGPACEDQCNGDGDCLANCYAQCDDASYHCWGMQGQGSYCIYCTYGACSYIWWEVDSQGNLIDSWCI